MSVWKHMEPGLKIKMIRDHHRKDSSAADIAESISAELKETVTRNMVIGYYHRKPSRFLDKPLRVNPPKKVKEVKKAPLRNPITPLNVRRIQRKHIVKHPEAPEVREDRRELVRLLDESRLPEAKPLTDVGSNECRWVVSTEPYLYCAEACEGTYCVEHSVLMYSDYRPSLTMR